MEISLSRTIRLACQRTMPADDEFPNEYDSLSTTVSMAIILFISHPIFYITYFATLIECVSNAYDFILCLY